GAGDWVEFRATDPSRVVSMLGNVDTRGGNAAGSGTNGGAGGIFVSRSPTVIGANLTIDTRGGSGSGGGASGGGGSLAFEQAVTLSGNLTLRGGPDGVFMQSVDA